MVEQLNKVQEVRTKRRKVLYEVDEQEIADPCRSFNPVSLSALQIGADNERCGLHQPVGFTTCFPLAKGTDRENCEGPKYG
jgi:hypothetical protein